MNIQKLKKKKEKVLSDGNLNHLFYTCKELADAYFGQEMFKEALEEYKEMERISHANNNKMDLARCNRMIGEVYCEMGEFEKALKHQIKHLAISCEEDDKVEKQRALATIGRTYLLQAESYTDLKSEKKDVALANAKKHFLQSLSVCEQLQDEDVGAKQRMEMRSRLFLNLGLVLESENQLDHAIDHLTKAVMISKKLELWEDLLRTYSALGSVYFKKRDSKLAISTYDLGITVAERLPDKGKHIATILALKAEVLLELPDFLGARQSLMRAYKLNVGSKNDNIEIERKLRIVAAMCEAEEALTNLSPEGDYALRKKRYEDLGDMASDIGCFSTALTYYHLMLECVEKCGNEKNALIESYVSLAQTYKDNGQYRDALDYFKKELNLEDDNPSEACRTSMNIAEIYGIIGEVDQMVEYYNKAKLYSEMFGDDKMKRTVLFCAHKALVEAGCIPEAETFQRELNKYSHLVESDSENEEEREEKKQFGAHICLEDLSDVDAEETYDCDRRKFTRTRAKPKNNLQKRNEKGETPLHIAAISGNELLTAKLIDQGHSVDVKDYSGWTPLHEACNHGHKNVAEILLSKGATVNDRGGPHCDGVTPLLDAASNGSLDCIELLLSYGASPLMRTNSGESVLDCLNAWRKRRLEEIGVDLEDDILAQFLSIYKKIQLILEKAGQKITYKDSNLRDMVKDGRQSRCSMTETSNKRQTNVTRIRKPKGKDSINSQRFQSVEDAADEYENAMKALRFRHEQIVSPMAKPPVIPALLPIGECVDDNWLEDDLDSTRPNKKRRTCEFGGGQPQRSNTGNKHVETPFSSPSSTHSDDYVPLDTSDIEKISQKNSIEPPVTTLLHDGNMDTPSTSGIFSNKLKEMNASRRKQISLMATGVTKEKIVRTSQTVLNTPTILSSIPQFNCVKVRVEEKLLLVPFPQTPSQPLTVAWLATELANRYRSLEGIEPVLRIETQDGALLVDSDPVTLLMGMGELIGRVQSWKLPPMTTIYQEACLSANIDSNSQVSTELEACQATNSVKLEDFYLDQKQLGPILKALTYYLPLQVLSLSGNNVADVYIKDIANCVVKLDQLKTLDISNINITSSGLASFAKVIIENKALQKLESLNIGSNPLGDCISPLAELLNVLPALRSLSLPAVDLTQDSFRSCPYYCLDTLESLDVNYNEIGSEGVIDILGRLNHQVLVELRMAGTSDSTIREIAFFLQNYSPATLKLLDLSYCSGTDYDISELIKGIENCQQLTHLCIDGIDEATGRSIESLLSLNSLQELSLCGIQVNQPVQITTNQLSSLALSSCVDQAWATQRGPFGFFLAETAARQRTTTH